MNLQSTSQTQTTHKTLEECIKESYSGLQNTIKEFQNGNTIQINNSHSHKYLQPLCYADIHALTKDSPPHLLKALYFCEDYTFLDSNRNPSLTESNITKTFGYKSSFYLSFISDKDSLGNEYLQARKALYKTYQLIKQEQTQVLEQTQAIEQERLELQRSKEELEQQLQGLDSKERESKLQELQRKQERELREKQREKERQERLSSRNTINKDSHLFLESKDKNNVIIFLDSANSLSNLIHIHNERIDIFTKDSTRLDIQELESLIKEYSKSFRDSSNTDSNSIESKTNNTESNNQESKLTLDSLHSSNTQIFLYSYLLTGGTESNKPYNECFFGELDSKNTMGLDDTKPIYHLSGEIDYDTKDSKESFTQTLQVSP